MKADSTKLLALEPSPNEVENHGIPNLQVLRVPLPSPEKRQRVHGKKLNFFCDDAQNEIMRCKPTATSINACGKRINVPNSIRDSFIKPCCQELFPNDQNTMIYHSDVVKRQKVTSESIQKTSSTLAARRKLKFKSKALGADCSPRLHRTLQKINIQCDFHESTTMAFGKAHQHQAEA